MQEGTCIVTVPSLTSHSSREQVETFPPSPNQVVKLNKALPRSRGMFFFKGTMYMDYGMYTVQGIVYGGGYHAV